MGLLIGIGGISRAGKSELSQFLLNNLSNAEIIHQDDYVKPEIQIPRIKDRSDWEHPDSIDWSALKSSVSKSLLNYSFTLLEGIFAFHNTELENQMSLKIQLSLEKERFVDLKQKDNRWGDEPKWFIAHIWVSHLTYGQPSTEQNLLKIHTISDTDYELVHQKILNL